MAAPDPAAPCRLEIDAAGVLVMVIEDHEGKAVRYLIEPAVEGLDDWACTLRRLDGAAGPYRVFRRMNGRWGCTCLDTVKGRARKQGRLCKHRFSVQKYWLNHQRLFPRGHHDPQEEAR